MKPGRRVFIASGVGAAAAAAAGAVGRLARAGLDSAASLDGGPPARWAYSVDPGVVYLNHASIGTMPTAVRDAYIENIRRVETNPWLYMWGPAWAEPVERAHADAAAYLGCEAGDAAIIHNTTEAFGMLANGLDIGPGDEVLFSSLNHIGASAAWRSASGARGYSVRQFEFPIAGAPGMTAADVVEIYAREIRDGTRVLVIPHIDNIIGVRHPVAEIARAARARGIGFIAVDGAQATGVIDEPIGAMGVDFYATSAHKGLQAPKGFGLLYVSPAARERIRPTVVTWGGARWRESARKYTDFGTRNLPGLIALRDAVAFQRAIGRDRIESHAMSLRERLRRRVEAERGLSWLSPGDAEMGGALAMVGVGRKSPDEVFEVMWREHGYVFRPFGGGPARGVRVSVHAMNTIEEIDGFVGALVRMR